MSWSLPSYASISETLTASLAQASEFKPALHNDNTPTRMSYNVATKLATAITDTDFILIPIRALQPGELFDFDYHGSSGFLILVTKGLPTVEVQYMIVEVESLLRL